MPALWQARSRKSEWELVRMRAAAAQGLAAMQAAPALVVPGRPEADVLSELAHVMRLAGHEGTIRFRGLNHEFFFGQVLAGPGAAVPGPTDTPLCGWGLSSAQGRGPSRRPLRAGDAVVVDVSGLSEGYVSDQTRTFFLGEPPELLRRAHDVCLEILAACAELLRPGTAASAVYERGLEIATRAGLGDHFMGHGPGRVRFVGHCIGLELNEPPYLSRGWDEPLAEGNVAALEPKLVFPGVGAVGIENSYVVTAAGPQRLTGSADVALQVPA
jgi:Xaa-Pro dipeptidase